MIAHRGGAGKLKTATSHSVPQTLQSPQWASFITSPPQTSLKFALEKTARRSLRQIHEPVPKVSVRTFSLVLITVTPVARIGSAFPGFLQFDFFLYLRLRSKLCSLGLSASFSVSDRLFDVHSPKLDSKINSGNCHNTFLKLPRTPFL